MIGRSDKILVGGYNLAAKVTKVDINASREKLPATTVASSNKVYESGFRNATVAVEGLYESNTTTLDKITDVIAAAFYTGDEQIVTIGYGLYALGGDARIFDGCVGDWDLPINAGQLILTNGNFTSNNAMMRGRWLISELVAAGTTTGTSIDNGAGTTNGGLFHAHWQNDDATGISIPLQHSTDDSTWVDLAEVLSGTRATGGYAFALNPSDTDTIIFNGVTFTFITGSSTSTDIQIKGTLALTMAEAAAVLNASASGSVNVATYTATSTGITVSYDAPGTGGNAYTLGTVNGGNSTRTGATLSGGTNATASEHNAGSVRVAAGTTVNRHLRVKPTVTGGDTVLLSAAFARG
jgi:hypothetical protein